MTTRTISGVDRVIDTDKALDNALHLADTLEAESMADLKPWMIARLIRAAIADDLAASVASDKRQS